MELNTTIQSPILEELFTARKACIILPTYNNASSLGIVIEQSLKQTSHVIVVNDGSTDHTADILSHYSDIHIVNYEQNQGKGYAIRQGFKYALNSGYHNAITIDTDGQHFPADCIHFFRKNEEVTDSLLIGARNMNSENVPGKSSFGNKFSNFWFKVETGKNMPDTQSGFRWYPIHLYKDTKWFTKKFEFEIEVIVRSSWMGIDILPVPIGVYYPKPSERVSHFRPFKDFTRISILNTVLVFVAFLYIKPRDLVLRPLKKKGVRRGLKELLFNPQETVLKRAASVGFGIFMGIIPIWGFQLLVGIPMAIAMKLNKTLFIIAANISIFPPIIWAASLATGKLIFNNPNWRVDFRNLSLDQVTQMGKEFFVGGTLLAFLASLLFFLLTYFILRIKQKTRP